AGIGLAVVRNSVNGSLDVVNVEKSAVQRVAVRAIWREQERAIDVEQVSVGLAPTETGALCVYFGCKLLWRLFGAVHYTTMRRSMLRAMPVESSESMTTAHSRTSPVAASKRTGMLFRNFETTISFLTPITPSNGPVMPTSVI